ncbi:isocitrate lyase/PEP mutase family protein [soil metagenome]
MTERNSSTNWPTAAEKRRSLRAMLRQPQAIIAPSVGDALSAILVEAAGLPAVHCSGSVLHNARGFADGGLLTMTEMAASMAAIAESVRLPLIADADTGFGSAANVMRTVREYERAGAAAMHIEDQLTPTRPAMIKGFHIETVARQVMVEKIKAAVDAREDEGFMIVARCDFKGDPQEVVDRLAAYLEAGADAAWLPPGPIDQMRAVRRSLSKPLIGVMAATMNISEFSELANCALLPGSMQVASVHAQQQLLESLKRTGGTKDYFDRHAGIEDARGLYAGTGVAALLDIDRRYPAR